MKRRTVIFCIMLFIICVLGGCQKKEKEEKVFRVLVESLLQDEAETAKKEWEKEHTDVQMKIEVLSRDKEKRSMQIQKIRTEILAGKGPDAFLLNCYEEFTDQSENLFENVNKAMESGTFADLASYMEKDAYWKSGQYQMALLGAGKIQEKQYVLPLGCDYPVYLFPEGEEGIDTDDLGTWIKKVYESGTEEQKQAVFGGMMRVCAKLSQPAVDYEKGKVQFRKEEWAEMVSDCLIKEDILLKNFQEYEENRRYFFDVSQIFYINEMEDYKFKTQCIPNLYGKHIAAVTCYGAVSMASEYKKEGYQYLMKFLDGKRLCEWMEESNISFPITCVPVQERGFVNWMKAYDEEKEQRMVQSFWEIDGAYFTTQAEIEMFEKILDLFSQSDVMTEEAIKEEVEKIASEIEEQYRKQVKE